MKYFVRATVFFVAAESVSCYIEDHMVGRRQSPYATSSWSPQTFTPKIRIRPMGEPSVNEEEKINVDSKADAIIRREYSAWTKRHGKEKDEYRFGIFKKNFVLQMEMNRKNGEFFLLNEFGDLTKEEYIEALKSSKHSKTVGEAEEESTGSYDPRSTDAPSTLRPAPIQKLEDLAQEVLESAMESSRQSIAEEKKKILEARRKRRHASNAASSISREKYDAISSDLYEPVIAPYASPVSYFDYVNQPMQPLDDFVRRPTLMSAAISSVSETFRRHLFKDAEPRWEDHVYAMDFGDDEDYSHDASDVWNEEYADYTNEESESYGDSIQYFEW